MQKRHLEALLLRHIYPLKRDFDLLSDMLYWPLIDAVLWGVTSQWIGSSSGTEQIIASILIGLVLWNVIWRSQSEISRNMIDEIWNNNLVNLFSTPLRVKEWVVSVVLLSVIKMTVTITLLMTVIFLLYRVNVLILQWWLPVFMVGAMMTGWWVGFISSSIVLKYGPKMQTVVWGLPGILLPFSVVFFPLEKLPWFLQPISRMIPTTYIFESMRALVQTGHFEITNVLISLGLNILYLALSIYLFLRSFQYSRSLGLGRFNN